MKNERTSRTTVHAAPAWAAQVKASKEALTFYSENYGRTPSADLDRWRANGLGAIAAACRGHAAGVAGVAAAKAQQASRTDCLGCGALLKHYEIACSYCTRERA